MAYSTERYDEAQRIIDRRRERAGIEAQDKFDEISAKIPELEEIQRKLSQIGLSISKLFFESKDMKADVEKLMHESLALQERKKEILIKNGYSPDDLTVKYTCPACSDTGFVNNRRCKCYLQLLKELEHKKIAKIAPIDDCTFDTFDTRYYPETALDNGISPKNKAEKILQSCRRYATSFTKSSPSLLFMGSTGLGKTHLSLAIANVVINKGYSVIYGTAQNILRDLECENFGKADNPTYYENDILDCDLLILDDLGTEFRNAYTVACLYNIINTRISAKLPTIISTNFDYNELEDKYDQRVISRLAGNYTPLILVGNDIRYIKR